MIPTLERVLAGRDLWSIVRKAAAAFISDHAASMGAALAYYTLFSIAPVLIIALAIVGYVFGAEVAQQRVLAELPALLGEGGAAAVRDLVLSAHYSNQKGLAAIIGVIALVAGAMSVFQELQQALEKIWKTPEVARSVAWWRFVRARMLSLGLVLGIGFLLLVSLLASAALDAVSQWLGGFLPPLLYWVAWLNYIVSFGMTVVLFALIFKYTPRERIGWQDVWVGAFFTTVLFTVGKTLIGIYLGKSAFSSAYGAAGSLIVLLLWIYYSAQIFLFGAEFTCAFAYARGSRRGHGQRSLRDTKGTPSSCNQSMM
jgi:membrane protein